MSATVSRIAACCRPAANHLLFVSVGREPQLEAFRELLPLTEKGYAAVGETGETDTPWLFAAGDCRAKNIRQLTTAVGDGSVAALAACRYIDRL